MNRREAISATAFLLGGTIAGAGFFLSGCSRKKAGKTLISTADVGFLDEVGETILPATASSPGAKAAEIGKFMKTIVEDCYSGQEQQIFIGGIEKLKKLSTKKFDKDFMELSAAEKHKLLVEIDGEAKDHEQSKSESEAVHYFTLMKQLTIWGYFSSEPGATKALRYVPVPGRYEGCVDYKAGEKAWAT